VPIGSSEGLEFNYPLAQPLREQDLTVYVYPTASPGSVSNALDFTVGAPDISVASASLIADNDSDNFFISLYNYGEDAKNVNVSLVYDTTDGTALYTKTIDALKGYAATMLKVSIDKNQVEVGPNGVRAVYAVAEPLENELSQMNNYYLLSVGAPGASAAVPVTGVSLDQTELTLAAGGQAALNAAVEPSDAANKAVTWSTSNPDAATVSQDGVVTAVGAGEAVITVTTEDGGFSAECTVTVSAAGNVFSADFSDNSAYIRNNVSPGSVKGYAIAAVYTKDMSLVAIDRKAFEVPAGSDSTVKFDLDFSKYPTAEYYRKVFFWNEDYMPLAAPIVN